MSRGLRATTTYIDEFFVKPSEVEDETMSKEFRRKIDEIERKMYGCLGIPREIIDNRKEAMAEEKNKEKESRRF